jgi:hypothetical protein
VAFRIGGASIASNAAANPDEAIGRIDLMTEDQRALLPDPTYVGRLIDLAIGELAVRGAA